MGVEIERRFLLKRIPTLREPYTDYADIAQGYLCTDPIVRVRLISRGGKYGEVTIKGKGTLSRAEFNLSTSFDEANEMFRLSKFSLWKRRHFIDGWEVDEFKGPLSGLWLAEIELSREDQEFTRPDWLGEEVTEKKCYSNARLAESGLPVGVALLHE